MYHYIYLSIKKMKLQLLKLFYITYNIYLAIYSISLELHIL